MRTKDEHKQDALFQATVKVVNEVGFAAASVSKIAKEAEISPATIYIYHENKEDLLVSTYIEIKKGFSEALLDSFDEELPIRDIFRNIWFNGFKHVGANTEQFQFTEQFASSPYSELINKQEVDAYFEPIYKVIMRGIEQKIIKDVKFEILAAFLFFPMMNLTNPKHCKDFKRTDENVETAFTLAWDAIKL